jgi:hypothetical protein
MDQFMAFALHRQLQIAKAASIHARFPIWNYWKGTSIFKHLVRFWGRPKVSFKLNEDALFDNQGVVIQGSIPESDLPILARALKLLKQARATHEVPLKISNYVIILECLFCGDLGEISHKVSERTAMFVENEATARLDVYRFVSQSYKIRSRYVHGQPLPSKVKQPASLLSTAEQIDGIVRRALIKFVKFHPEYITTKSEEERKNWFDKMLFDASMQKTHQNG